MDLTVCPLVPAHSTEAARLSKICFPGGPGESSIESSLNNPVNRYFEAVGDGVIVGLGGYTAVLDEADILDVAVHPDYRRRGIARRLCEAILADAKKHGVMTVFLEVRQSNCPAISLYKSLGFTECGIRKNYYSSPKEDAVLMLLPFSEEMDNG